MSWSGLSKFWKKTKQNKTKTNKQTSQQTNKQTKNFQIISNEYAFSDLWNLNFTEFLSLKNGWQPLLFESEDSADVWKLFGGLHNKLQKALLFNLANHERFELSHCTHA